jgi:HlyD family secretion protein
MPLPNPPHSLIPSPLSPRGRGAGGEGAALQKIPNSATGQFEYRSTNNPRRWAGLRRAQSSRASRAWLVPPYVCLALVVSGLPIGCDHPTTASQATETPPATAASVHTVKPERKTVRHRIEQPGFNIQAFQEAPLCAKIPGYIEKWNVDIGKRVQKGDVLAVLYVPEMKVDVDRKHAGLRQAAAHIEQAKATVLMAQAQLDRSKSQYERLSRVGRSGVLDQENVDESRLNYETARAAFDKAKADAQFANAQQEAAKADLAYAKTMLDYATIRAPFDGVVTRRNINVGDFVQPPAGGAKAQSLFVVAQIDPVRVFVNVPGSDAPWIKDGNPVTLELQGAGGHIIQSQVTRNARSLDPQNRTLTTEIDVPNPIGNLLPGMYVQSRILIEHPNVWTLPESAVLTEGDRTFCFCVEEGKAVRTPLQIALTGNGLVEVLQKQTAVSLSNSEPQWTPITGTEEVIVGAPLGLANGQNVTVASPAR